MYQGLLAGQWECPSVLLRDGSEGVVTGETSSENAGVEVKEAERKLKANSLLFEDLGLPRESVRGER